MDRAGVTLFSDIYELFLSKITDDMYMELTEEETKKLLEELLISSIPKFEFPRFNIFDYQKGKQNIVTINSIDNFPDQGDIDTFYVYNNQIYIWKKDESKYQVISTPT